VIEFARGIDNLVDYHGDLVDIFTHPEAECSSRLNYYFDVFLQEVKKVSVGDYIKEVNRYNDCLKASGDQGEKIFFGEAERRYPELEVHYSRSGVAQPARRRDLLRFLLDNSEFLARDENVWMRSILEIVRKTSLFFQPQIRTKIMNEGWASYWHERLFLQDDRIMGHEVDFARIHAGVTSMPRVGLNPYALGMRLFTYIEEQAAKGRLSFAFQRLLDSDARSRFDAGSATGRDFIFTVRENLCDYLFLKNHLDQDFMERHKLFVAGKRLDQQRMVWQYYVKSRKAHDYQQMMLKSLYHPPVITIDQTKGIEGTLYLNHMFEGKQLVQEYIANTMIGIEFLWGGPVHLETSEAQVTAEASSAVRHEEPREEEITWQRVLYSMNGKVLSKKKL
jgi:stage V sporulation protein R